MRMQWNNVYNMWFKLDRSLFLTNSLNIQVFLLHEENQALHFFHLVLLHLLEYCSLYQLTIDA